MAVQESAVPGKKRVPVQTMLDNTILVFSGLFTHNYWYNAVPQYLRQAEKLFFKLI